MQEKNISYTRRVEQGLKTLTGKWTVQILCAMKDHPIRLSELRRLYPAASKKALTASLRSLEAAGIVLRKDLSTSVLRVEYELEASMRGPVTALLDRMAEWGAYFD